MRVDASGMPNQAGRQVKMGAPVTISNIQHIGLGQKIGQAQFFVSAVQIHIILMYLQITLDIVARRVVDFEAVRSEENELPAASRNVAAGCSCRWPGATLSRSATVHCDRPVAGFRGVENESVNVAAFILCSTRKFLAER